MKVYKGLLFILFLLVSIQLAFGLKTGEVEIGVGGSYDGKVRVWRDWNARMVFKDDSLTTGVVLGDLVGGMADHGTLSGLGDDDHTQYLNSGRHTSVHNATYNDVLAISPDVNGNDSIGEHVEDTDIHLDRWESETIKAPWYFNDTTEFKNDVRLSDNGAAGDAAIVFEAGETDARIEWDHSEEQFTFNKTVYGDVAKWGTLKANECYVDGWLYGRDESDDRSGKIEGFVSIEGIAYNDLLDKSVNEDISGQWDFLNAVNVTKGDVWTTPTVRKAFSARLNKYVTPDDDVSGLLFKGAQIESEFKIYGPKNISDSVNIGVESEARSLERTSSGEALTNVGILGKARSDSSLSGVIGVAGFANYQKDNRFRIGVLGGLESSLIDSPTNIPEGEWGGFFDDDVYCSDTLFVQEGVNIGNATGAEAGEIRQSGNHSIGIDGTADGITRWCSSTQGNYVEMKSESKGYLSAYNMPLQMLSSNDCITFNTGAGKNLYQYCGGLFQWGDRDTGYVNRMTLNSSTGELKLLDGFIDQDGTGANSFEGNINAEAGVNVGTASGAETGDVRLSGKLVVESSHTPQSCTDTGTTGTIAWNGGYVYVCVGENQWGRTALTTSGW